MAEGSLKIAQHITTVALTWGYMIGVYFGLMLRFHNHLFIIQGQ